MSEVTHHLHVDLENVKACASVTIDANGDHYVTEVEVFGITFTQGDIYDVVAEAVYNDENLLRTFAEAA